MREVLNAVFRFQVLGCWSRRTQTIVGGANEGLSSVMKEKDTEMYFVFCPGRENMGWNKQRGEQRLVCGYPWSKVWKCVPGHLGWSSAVGDILFERLRLRNLGGTVAPLIHGIWTSLKVGAGWKVAAWVVVKPNCGTAMKCLVGKVKWRKSCSRHIVLPPGERSVKFQKAGRFNQPRMFHGVTKLCQCHCLHSHVLHCSFKAHRFLC